MRSGPPGSTISDVQLITNEKHNAVVEKFSIECLK